MTHPPDNSWVAPLGLDPADGPHRFACEAMAATFEIIILGQNAEYARQAASAAFAELRQLEQELSRFIPCSDVAQLNAMAGREAVPVGIATMDCLQLAAWIHAETAGAFDVTIGPLLDCWREADSQSRSPSAQELAAARTRTGMNMVLLDPRQHLAALSTEGMAIDLGAIGKGYALDHLANLLREWSIETALLHGGQSSVLAIGSPPGQPGWSVALRNPASQSDSLGTVWLRDQALSGSGMQLHGRHIIDPRTGQPAEGKSGTWALASTAGESDAISTAFMVMTPAEVELYRVQHPQIGGMLLPDPADPQNPLPGPWPAASWPTL